jgi:hypothetical protein
VAPGAVTVSADFDANAVVTAMLASPEINARLADIIKFSPEVRAAFKVMYHNEQATSQASGPQTTGEGGINIGTVLLNGSSGIILAGLAGVGLAGFLLWKLRKSKTLIDMLVKYNEDSVGVDTEKLRGMALSRKVEPLLRSRISKVRKNGDKKCVPHGG